MKKLSQTLVMLLLLFAWGLSQNHYILDFDGTDDYVRYSDDATLGIMDGATNYTIEAWIYPKDGVIQEYDRVLQRYYTFAIVMYDQNDDGKVEDWYFQVYNTGTSSWQYFNTEGDATLTLDAWNHISVVNNATSNTLKLFVNGVDVTISGGYSAFSLPSSFDSDNLYIGQKGNGTSFFAGYIDEVRLKNSAENPDTLHFHKNDPPYNPDPATAALFHFDEGTGSVTANEASGTDARLGSTTIGDAAEPVWRTWDYNGSDLSLPVELSSFTAVSGNGRVTLRWETAAEINNEGFIIQRATSVDGDYEEISSYVFNPDLRGAGNSSRSHSYEFIDFSVINEHSYWYKLVDVDVNGNRTEHGPIFTRPTAQNSGLETTTGAGLPQHFALNQNYPNPFNPETHISFDVPESDAGIQQVQIIIFDMTGKKIRTLFDGQIAAGTYTLLWNGKNDAGQEMASGIYIVGLKTPSFVTHRKMTLLR